MRRLFLKSSHWRLGQEEKRVGGSCDRLFPSRYRHCIAENNIITTLYFLPHISPSPGDEDIPSVLEAQ